MGGELMAILAVAVVLIATVGLFGKRLRLPGRSAPDRAPEPVPTTAPPDRLGPLGQSFRAEAAAGRHDALLRRLDQELPEWPAASTLIEAARDLFALESALDAARAAGVPDAVTRPAAEEAKDTAELLWGRAERLAAAGRSGVLSPRLEADIERQDDQLMRLRESIREARAGLSELSLSGDERPNAVRRAEGRFRALADTARELQELDQGPA
jgi:hypothetical protein